MSPLQILTDALQAIPAWLRKALLILFAVLVVAEQIARILEVDLDYSKIDQVFVLVGGYLGVQSAANVRNVQPQHRDDQLELEYPKD